jgi:hypothetical protein
MRAAHQQPWTPENMKKILLSSVTLLGLTAAASAADLPRRAAPPGATTTATTT